VVIAIRLRRFRLKRHERSSDKAKTGEGRGVYGL